MYRADLIPQTCSVCVLQIEKVVLSLIKVHVKNPFKCCMLDENMWILKGNFYFYRHAYMPWTFLLYQKDKESGYLHLEQDLICQRAKRVASL